VRTEQQEDKPDTTLPRRRLGKAMREAREAAGYSLAQLADVTEGFSRSALSRLERGEVEKIKPIEVEYLCRFLSLPDERVEYMANLSRQQNTKSLWQGDRDAFYPGFRMYLELESAATELEFFQSLIVPGLLQTADYARAVLQADDIESQVATRLRRASILTRKHNPKRAKFLLHEACFLNMVGSPTIMGQQVRHVLDMGANDNVSVRVLPCAAGFPAGGPIPPYIILSAPDEPPVIYAESAIGAMLFEEEDDVRKYRLIHEKLRLATLGEAPTRDWLRELARKYER